MSDPIPPDEEHGAALLDGLRRQLAARPSTALFRVVEIGRDVRGGRLRHGQVWHVDLDHVRRFGRALAANSAAQQVVVADATGAVLERLAVAPAAAAAAAGWAGWRDVPLPPLPARAPRPPCPPARTSAAEVDVPLMQDALPD